MKIIDLLNKIANGEEVPKKIRIDHWCYKFEWVEYRSNYYDKDIRVDLTECLSCDKEELNYEVHEIDEEKGLPEKLDIEQDSPTSNYYIRNEYGTKCGLTKHSKIIVDKINEIIDYLEKQRR